MDEPKPMMLSDQLAVFFQDRPARLPFVDQCLALFVFLQGRIEVSLFHETAPVVMFLAGAAGVEPAYFGSKPNALPLSYTPE